MTTKERNNGHRNTSTEGIIKIERQGNLAKEFLEVGKDFDEALGRCVILDHDQRNDIILYKSQLEMFDMWDEIQHLTSWLNASAAVGGFNRSLAAMTEVGIFMAEGAGVHISKENQKVLAEMQKLKAQAMNKEQQQKEQVGG